MISTGMRLDVGPSLVTGTRLGCVVVSAIFMPVERQVRCTADCNARRRNALKNARNQQYCFFSFFFCAGATVPRCARPLFVTPHYPTLPHLTPSQVPLQLVSQQQHQHQCSTNVQARLCTGTRLLARLYDGSGHSHEKAA